MPPELRKRKVAAEPVATPPAKRTGPVGKAVEKVKNALSSDKKSTKAPDHATVGQIINLDGFGGDIETNDGEKTTFKQLVDKSIAGVVLFTYPKASTPGCTTQVCLFRDSYSALSATGYSIYGLSRDSPKANTTFKTKQSLPYPLLCDVKGTLIKSIGLQKAPASTQRGVFVLDKAGKVLAAEPGSPAGTLNVVKKLLEDSPRQNTDTSDIPAGEATSEDKKAADTAAEVADTAEKIDSNEAKSTTA